MSRPRTAVAAATAELRVLISSSYAPSAKLPNEQQLAAELKVSRSTVREALGALSTEGVVERRWGSGTFVLPPTATPQLSMASIRSYRERLENSGRTVVLVDATCVQETLPERAAGALDQAPRATGWRVERLFAVDGTPSAFMTEYLPATIRGVYVDPSPMLEIEMDLYATLNAHISGIVAHTETDFEAVAIPEQYAGALQVEPGWPVLLANQTTTGRRGERLAFGVTYHRTDVVRVRIMR